MEQTPKKTPDDKCVHNWVPVEADNQGNASALRCTKCGKKMLKG